VTLERPTPRGASLSSAVGASDFVAYATSDLLSLPVKIIPRRAHSTGLVARSNLACDATANLTVGSRARSAIRVYYHRRTH
jgi:hypothetical protein